jgi:hypothetical protein
LRVARLGTADPDLLLRQHLVELGVDHGLVGELARLALLIGGEAAGVALQPAAVQLDDAGGDGIEKAAIVGDAEDGAGESAQQVLEPADGGEVEVVGRLVEQQHVRRRGQRLRQRDPLLPAAGQRAHAHVGGQLQPGEDGVDAVAERPAVGRVEFGLQPVDPRQRSAVVGVLGQRRGRVVIVGQQLSRRADAQRDGIVDRCRRSSRAPARRKRRAPAAAHRARHRPGAPGPRGTLSSDDLPLPLRPIRPTRSACVELEVGAVEQGLVTVGEPRAGERDDRHGGQAAAGAGRQRVERGADGAIEQRHRFERSASRARRPAARRVPRA